MTCAPHPRPIASADVAALVAVVAVAAAGAAIGLATGISADLPVRPRLHGTAAEALAIAARNVTVCSTLTLAPHARPLRFRWPRNVVDVAAFVVLIPTTFLVALIAAHPGGLAYLPHAPLELAAIALAATWWWRHHHAPPTARQTATRLAIVAALLITAAPLETFLVPHR